MPEEPGDKLAAKVLWLESREAASRQRRAQWCLEVQEVTDSFPPEAWGLAAGAQESGWFLLEAVECYRQGMFLSALVNAHATCEQELAGRVAHRPEVAPRGWERWGLGRLIEHAEAQGWHSAETIALLKETNENRKSVYHLRAMSAPDSLSTRAYLRDPYYDKYEIKTRMRNELRLNALEAIRAAFAVRAED
jgi:hypothetical protein